MGCLAGTELVLSRLPVTLGPRQVPTNESDPYTHYTPGTPFIYSRGPLFDELVTGTINNAGFVNPQPYNATDTHPLVAVIGDSYVEAQMLPYHQTVHGRLANAIGEAGRVYSFGFASAPASQYLAYAKMAAERYQTDYLVVCVNSGDFYESLLTRWPDKGAYQFDDRPNGNFAMHLTPYTPSRVRNALRSSSLARYLVMNMELPVVMTRSLIQLPKALAFRRADIHALLQRESTPTDVVVPGEDLTGPDAQKAADLFLSLLPTYAKLPPSRIVLVVDPSRPHIYTGGPADPWTIERRRILQRAHDAGFHTVDLEPLFIDEYRTTGKTLEIPQDGHWNARGHEIVATQVQTALGIPYRVTKR